MRNTAPGGRAGVWCQPGECLSCDCCALPLPDVPMLSSSSRHSLVVKRLGLLQCSALLSLKISSHYSVLSSSISILCLTVSNDAIKLVFIAFIISLLQPRVYTWHHHALPTLLVPGQHCTPLVDELLTLFMGPPFIIQGIPITVL